MFRMIILTDGIVKERWLNLFHYYTQIILFYFKDYIMAQFGTNLSLHMSIRAHSDLAKSILIIHPKMEYLSAIE